MVDEVQVDPEFQSFLPRLSSDAYIALQIEILRDGCNDPLTVWEEENLLIDGHHRLDICKCNDIEYGCLRISLPNRDAAKRWMLHHARARRNCTADELSYLRGVEYNLEKRQDGGHGDQKSARQSGGPNAAQKIADDHNVSERTIERDAKHAEAVDAIAKNAGPDAKRVLLSGNNKVTKKKVAAIAKLPVKKQGKAVSEMVGDEKTMPAKKTAKPKAKVKEKIFELYHDSDTPFHTMLEKVKSLDERVSKEKFHKAIGGEKNEWFFVSHINEIHYMHLQIDEDGTYGLFIDEAERELCTAIHAQIARMKDACGKGNRFKFDLGLQRKVVRDMYDLVRKASTHA